MNQDETRLYTGSADNEIRVYSLQPIAPGQDSEVRTKLCSIRLVIRYSEICNIAAILWLKKQPMELE